MTLMYGKLIAQHTENINGHRNLEGVVVHAYWWFSAIHRLCIQSQYHGYWCTGSLRRQGINSNGIDIFLLEYPVSTPEGLMF